jgi:hypothetical protein
VSTETQQLDSASAPAGFTNDAPFKKKGKKKDAAGSALKALAGIGIALSIIAIALSAVSM